MRRLRQATLLTALIATLAVQPALAADALGALPDMEADTTAVASKPVSGEAITVKVNMARILRIASPAATVILGNPGVADVAIQDPQTLVLTGKSFGQTNLIILDDMGNPIADTMVEVIQAQADLVTMFQGAQRQTMVCNPVCQPMIMLGDDIGYTSGVVNSKGIVAGAAR